MRILLAIATVVFSSASASAQALDQASSCWTLATKGEVEVTREDGSTVRDTLLCMGRDQVLLAKSGAIPIDSVRQISKPRDGVLDGFLKGASVGLVFLVFCAPDCPGEAAARITLGYGLLGVMLDAAQGNNTTIFRKGPAPSVAWRVRF